MLWPVYHARSRWTQVMPARIAACLKSAHGPMYTERNVHHWLRSMRYFPFRLAVGRLVRL
jgi:hypothetical protein